MSNKVVESLLSQSQSPPQPSIPGTLDRHQQSGARGSSRGGKKAAEEDEEGPRHQFAESETRYLMEWLMDARHRLSVGHALQAGKFHEWEVAAGMIVITICIVAATMAMGTERTQDGEVFKYFLCILSVLGTIVSFIFANTQFTQRQEQHRLSWISYTVFANDTEAALARHAAGDKSFHAQRHLDSLYERWKELKGPAFDIPILPDPARQEPPSTADSVIRKWMAFAETQEQRHQYAAKAYDIVSIVWRSLWMFVTVMSTAFSLGTFLPKNTQWYIAYTYISLLLNIFAVMVMTFLNFERYSTVSEQHQLVAEKCRVLRDYAAKLLAQRSAHRESMSEVFIGESLEMLRGMLNEIAVNSPVVPATMNRWLDTKVPSSYVFFRSGSTAPPIPATEPAIAISKDNGVDEGYLQGGAKLL